MHGPPWARLQRIARVLPQRLTTRSGLSTTIDQDLDVEVETLARGRASLLPVRSAAVISCKDVHALHKQ
jgi:hypothetical protein